LKWQILLGNSTTRSTKGAQRLEKQTTTTEARIKLPHPTNPRTTPIWEENKKTAPNPK
jgi:hypothetical protein